MMDQPSPPSPEQTEQTIEQMTRSKTAVKAVLIKLRNRIGFLIAENKLHNVKECSSRLDDTFDNAM